MHRALLTVHFGTAAPDSRALDLGGVEAALTAAFPHLQRLTAYTSPTIRRILERRSETLLSLEQALEQAVQEGVEELFLLPSHLLPGYEYDAICETAAAFRPRFAALRLALPLLGDTWGVRELGDILARRFEKRPGRAVVLVGHGTAHPGNLVYPALQGVLDLMGREDVLIGTVEGWPGQEEVLSRLEQLDAREVLLAPLLLTAGTHAKEDIAGEGADSWRSRLTQAGYQVELSLDGLGRLPQVQGLYVRRVQDLMEG